MSIAPIKLTRRHRVRISLATRKLKALWSVVKEVVALRGGLGTGRGNWNMRLIGMRRRGLRVESRWMIDTGILIYSGLVRGGGKMEGVRWRWGSLLYFRIAAEKFVLSCWRLWNSRLNLLPKFCPFHSLAWGVPCLWTIVYITIWLYGAP